LRYNLLAKSKNSTEEEEMGGIATILGAWIYRED